MRYLAIIQVLFGIAIFIFSYAIVTHIDLVQDRISSPGEIIADYIPPDPSPELILLILSLVITICGIIQKRYHIKLALFQTIAGLIMIVIFIILSIKASQVGHLGGIFMLAYISLVLGPVVSFIGIFQVINWIPSKFRQGKPDRNCS